MKNKQFRILMIAFLLTAISGCNKDYLSKTSDVNSLSQAIRLSVNAGTITAIKQSYSLLSNEEKQQLWNTKWNYILKNDASKLSNEQKLIVTKIKSFVDRKTISELMKDPKDGEIFIKSNLPYFEKHFSKDQLYLLFECSFFCEDFSIFKSMEYLSKIDERYKGNSLNYANRIAPPSGTPNCECYYSIYCSIGGGGGGICNTGGCTKIGDCGLTGSSNCEGRCG